VDNTINNLRVVSLTTRPTKHGRKAIAVSNRSIFYAARHPLHIDHASIIRRIQRLLPQPTLSLLYRIALDNKISSSDTSRRAVNHTVRL